jgi:hypothetical protein
MKINGKQYHNKVSVFLFELLCITIYSIVEFEVELNVPRPRALILFFSMCVYTLIFLLKTLRFTLALVFSPGLLDVNIRQTFERKTQSK